MYFLTCAQYTCARVVYTVYSKGLWRWCSVRSPDLANLLCKYTLFQKKDLFPSPDKTRWTGAQSTVVSPVIYHACFCRTPPSRELPNFSSRDANSSSYRTSFNSVPSLNTTGRPKSKQNVTLNDGTRWAGWRRGHLEVPSSIQSVPVSALHFFGLQTDDGTYKRPLKEADVLHLVRYQLLSLLQPLAATGQ